MATQRFHLAEFNISRLRAPLGSPEIKEFTDFLAPVNRFAEESPGFIWRLTAPNGEASSYLPPAYADELIVTNLTVWQDLASLKNFAFQTVHAYFLRNRKKWFENFPSQKLVMWWIPEGCLPSLEEAKSKLDYLEEHGVSAQAFTFQSAFDSAGNPVKHEAD